MSDNIDYEANLIKRYKFWSAYLAEDQSYLGRLIIALNRDGEIDPFTEVNKEETFELQEIIKEFSKAFDKLYKPTRLNYGNLRNHWHHCHWHVIPRYEGHDFGLRKVGGFEFRDKNPGRNYAPSPKIKIPEKIFRKIQTDIKSAINN